MATEVGPLRANELDAANAIYAELGFQPSTPDDPTFGLRDECRLIALGRYQGHLDGALEIGGFWVDPSRRGQGLARRMVERVLGALPGEREAWCIAFTHLASFYASFGMERVERRADMPDSIRAKLQFCLEQESLGKYHPTVALRIRTQHGAGNGRRPRAPCRR